MSVNRIGFRFNREIGNVKIMPVKFLNKREFYLEGTLKLIGGLFLPGMAKIKNCKKMHLSYNKLNGNK